jgi:hypothetical protein
VIRLLRLFSYVRDLELRIQESRDERDRINALESEAEGLRVALAESTQQNLRLQDRLDSALEDRGKLWELTSQCINAERAAYQSHVNMSWREHGLGLPFPDAPAPPPKSDVVSDPVKRRMLPSERVAAATAEFVRNNYPEG